MKKRASFIAMLMSVAIAAETYAYTKPNKYEVEEAIELANSYWQSHHSARHSYFWNWAVYHVGNMEAYKTLGKEEYLKYTETWAEYNNWKGATGNNWNYTYGEQNVLFGDCQICFQVYADLYNIAPEPYKIARALDVMEYQVHTSNNDYWWWVDGLFMVMPVMTKLYNITHEQIYLEKMHEYWTYSNSIMYDEETGLYFRDAGYVYPKHKTNSGKKDFWARGDGWIFAAFARVLDELPSDDKYRDEYVSYFQRMAATLKQHQQSGGYWTRSIIDPDYAPGCETSGTALMTSGFAWGVNNGILDEQEYGDVIEKAWAYLSTVAMHEDGFIGYVQPIGANAAPGTTVGSSQTADFGVGAFLLACCQLYDYATDEQYARPPKLLSATLIDATTISLTFNMDIDVEDANQLEHYAIDNIPFSGSVDVTGSLVSLHIDDELAYGHHTVKVEGVTSSLGGVMKESAEKVVSLPVPLYDNTLIANVTASGFQEGHPPANAIDNHLSTRWSYNGVGQWICFELNELTEIDAVDIAFYQGDTRYSYFDIQTSMLGTVFITVLPEQSSSGTTNNLERYHFEPRNARFVRLICNGNSQGGDQWNSITEFRVVPTANNADDIKPVSLQDDKASYYYDLQGRRLSHPASQGIYISNGKKIIIK